MINLGDKVIDKVSGWIGIVVERREFLNGCVQYSVQGKVTKDKQEIISYAIDEAQLEVVPKKKVKVKRKRTGGPTIRVQ